MSKPVDVVSAVSDFNKDALKHVEPEVKNPLPTADDVEKEKKEADLLKQITQGTELKHTVTKEKVHMPTAEGKSLTQTGDLRLYFGFEIEQERKAAAAGK
ncbi:hypothetical protein ACTXT7_015597 [Hymenolepis weldensis]